MHAYLIRRIATTIPVLIGVTFMTFLMANLAPGDPVLMMIDPESIRDLGPEWLEMRKAQLGLDQPLLVRYVLWLKEVAQGNLGYSFGTREPVLTEILARLGPTLLLMGCSLVLAILIAIPLGITAAVRQYSLIDYISGVLGILAFCIPGFFLSLGAIYLFSIKWRLLPSGGMPVSGELKDLVGSLVLPVLVLGLTQVAPLLRYTRSSVLDTFRQDYVKTAWAKGLRPAAVVYRHVLPNAAIPIITVFAMSLPALIGGAVIIEQVFRWPGMGTLAINSLLRRDYPLIMGINLISTFSVVIANLLADFAYAVIDPRVRFD